MNSINKSLPIPNSIHLKQDGPVQYGDWNFYADFSISDVLKINMNKIMIENDMIIKSQKWNPFSQQTFCKNQENLTLIWQKNPDLSNMILTLKSSESRN